MILAWCSRAHHLALFICLLWECDLRHCHDAYSHNVFTYSCADTEMHTSELQQQSLNGHACISNGHRPEHQSNGQRTYKYANGNRCAHPAWRAPRPSVHGPVNGGRWRRMEGRGLLGNNLLGDRLQDKVSARVETRGLSEQQAGSEGSGRLSKTYIPPLGNCPAGLFQPLQGVCASFLGQVTWQVRTTSISDAETGP